jgi:predicted ArsR family transcriptional regulator
MSSAERRANTTAGYTKLGIKDPDQGRAMVRKRMDKLIAEGKVKSVEPKEGRAKKLYALP